VTERAWGTVREDYSASGDAWSFLRTTTPAARPTGGARTASPACAIATSCSLSPGLLERRDPILKERMFGLTSSEGNRGEDVKEYYFYVDALPTGAYMKLLYKYPHAEYPYGGCSTRTARAAARHGVRAARQRRLRRGSLLRHRRRIRQGGPDDICIRVEAFNRGRRAPAAPAAAAVVPQHVGLGRRNARSSRSLPAAPRARLPVASTADDSNAIRCRT
jgi:hypothetical protein